MQQSNIIHATAVKFNNCGLLLMGASGSGKSDLAFRLIQSGGTLIGDDYIHLKSMDNGLYGLPSEKIAGLIEIRGIGICEVNYLKQSKIDLCLFLQKEYPRMPDNNIYYEFARHKVQQYFINPFEISVIDKVKLLTQNDYEFRIRKNI